MSPKKTAEHVADRLSEMLTVDPTFAPFLAASGPNALKLINAVLFAAADGQTLVTMSDHNGQLVGFAVRPGQPQPERDTHGFLPHDPPPARTVDQEGNVFDVFRLPNTGVPYPSWPTGVPHTPSWPQPNGTPMRPGDNPMDDIRVVCGTDAPPTTPYPQS